jgi:competence protein ComEC
MAERASGVAFLRPTPPLVWIVVVMTLLACGVLAARRMRICLLGAAAALFAFLALRPGPSGPARGFSLEALDVGQGDALLVRWRDRAVLVDGGGPFDREASDFGRTHVLPKLLDRGVISLDAVLLTHPHPDHALGLFTILDELPVGALWRSSGQDEGGMFADLEAAAVRRGVPVRMLSTGERVKWRDAMLAVLHSGGPLTKKDGINNQSVVARFERDGRSALLTGDAGAAAEAQISSIFPSMRIRSDILKVGHHGSRGSTSAPFLDTVAPRAALLSCGRENRFGHPAAETLASLSARNVRLFRTDLESDVGFELLPASTRVLRRGVR